MSSIRNTRRLCIVAALGCVAASAQTGSIAITAPSGKLLVNGQMHLSARLTALSGTPLDGSGLQWSVSDSTIGTGGQDGTVKGMFPGDVTVTVSDSLTGAIAAVPLHVVPLSLSIQTSLPP